jgi:chemotaxis protein methyltransferase WspC
VVERAIKNRMEQTAATDHDAYLQQITPEELTALVELVVVPESWFYRDPQAFVAMTDFVRARLAANSDRLVRILSIPCAGGEEPYTMAMVLTDAGIPQNFIIDAYDISPPAWRARSGIYGRNAFRAQDLAFRDLHFTSAGDGDYRINDAIRKQVRFKQGNLLEFDLATRSRYYDVIFCRNLLIYFDKPTTKAAIAKLEALLMDDGQLFAGYAEVPSFCQNGFSPLPHNQAFGCRRKPPRHAQAGPRARARRRPAAARARSIASPPSRRRPAAAPPAPAHPRPRAGAAPRASAATATPAAARRRQPAGRSAPPGRPGRHQGGGDQMPRPSGAASGIGRSLLHPRPAERIDQQAARWHRTTGSAASTCSPTTTKRCATSPCWPKPTTTPRRRCAQGARRPHLQTPAGLLR